MTPFDHHATVRFRPIAVPITLRFMTRERYGQIGTVIGVMAVVSLVGAFLVPIPGRPEPGHEGEFLRQLQDWCRVTLFYGSGVLFAAAVVFWRLSRVPR